MNSTSYLLDNKKTEAGQRFVALSTIFDPVSLRQFDACGISSGWRCWEVGAGGVSLVQKMAKRVGPVGRILATDINDSWVKNAETSNIEIRKHDVANDRPPDELFDMVHARLVLVHLPDRMRAFQNMLSCLKPGGWLVVEDADPALQPLSCIDNYGPEQELANKIRTGFRTLLSKRGVELSYGRKLPRIFRSSGMIEVEAEAYFPIALPACLSLEIATINLIRSDLLEHCIATQDEIERHLQSVRCGTIDIAQPPMISVRGRKPLHDHAAA